MAVTPDHEVQSPPPGRFAGGSWRLDLVLPIAAVIVGVVVIGVITSPGPSGPVWVQQRGPTGPIALDSLVAAESGFALLSRVTEDGVVLWSTEDGASWQYQALPPGSTPDRLAASGNLLVAYDGMKSLVLAYSNGSWEVTEEVVFPDEMRTGQGPGRPGLVPGLDGFVMTSIAGDVWWWDLESFQPVVTSPDWGPGQTVEVPFDSSCQPPTRISPDVPPIASTDRGFAALVSSNPDEPFGIWPVCEPEMFLSGDGRSWDRSGVVLDDGAYVYGLAVREGRFIAVGGRGIDEPAVWTSTVDSDWEAMETFDALAGIELYTVRTGGAGWVIVGQETETSSPLGWVSPDGSCWTALPAEVDGDDAAVAQGRIALVHRVTYPEMWVTDMAGAGSC